MAVPKRKTSKSKRNMRRSQKGLVPANFTTNPTTGELTLSHRVSLDGYYKGRKVIETVKVQAADDDEE